MPWLWARGAGILNVIALWNFRRRGSTVTTGETATPLPNSLAVRSGSIGCAYEIELMVFFVYNTLLAPALRLVPINSYVLMFDCLIFFDSR